MLFGVVVVFLFCFFSVPLFSLTIISIATEVQIFYCSKMRESIFNKITFL